MSVGVAAIHEIACRVKTFAFFDDFGDERSFTTLVACTPKEDTSVVAVTQHQFLYTFEIHLTEPLVVRDIFRGMCLGASLVDDVKSIFVSQFQILVDRRVVRSAHTVKVMLFQYLHVLTDGLLVHGMTQFGVLHVCIGGIHLDGFSVQIESLMSDFRLLESHLAGDFLHHCARLIQQFQLESIEHRSFASPLVGIGHL